MDDGPGGHGYPSLIISQLDSRTAGAIRCSLVEGREGGTPQT